MADALLMRLSETSTITDPTTGSGDVALFPEAMGQSGHPFIMHVEDPPHKTRPRHHHHADVVYFYTKGEHHIEGEGTYRAGDVRWTRAGYAYGPETTGPEGGAWWVVTYGDPIPVNHEHSTVDVAAPPRNATSMDAAPNLTRSANLKEIATTVREIGGAVLEGFIAPDLLNTLDAELDGYLAARPSAGLPKSGSAGYDIFLGHRTVRLHGLVAKAPSSERLIADPRLVQLASDVIGSRASSVLLNAGELIQIGPGEPAQLLHRDTDSWPEVPLAREPVLVNAIVALDDFTLENGATYVALGSHVWPPHQRPASEHLIRAVMKRGDVLLFRADLFHGGGENISQGVRRAISVSYCAGWLRSVENSQLNVPIEKARNLSEAMQGLLGFAAHDATSRLGGMVGLFENGDPRLALMTP